MSPKPEVAPGKVGASRQQAPSKGIWEPVNYGKDLELTDVYFVTTDVGYVSGAGGTILKTTDGGATWTAQLGGEPGSTEKEILGLRFVDDTHGWAVQPVGIGQFKLLRTTDGEVWEQAGVIQGDLVDYAFTSASNGVYVDGNNNAARILHPVDGGRTWKETFPIRDCHFGVEVEGLPREVECTFASLALASPTVGYALGKSAPPLPDTIVVAKTVDGGISWSLAAVGGPSQVFDYAGGQWQTAFFLDEKNGFLATSGQRLYATSDGGQTWRGVVGGAGQAFRFADPEVGWSFEELRYRPSGYVAGYHGDNVLHYTTDGGRRWTSRAIRFPAGIGGFSLPRRDRAYVVGEHGMIYRYRVVPTEYARPGGIEAPAMPLFDSPLSQEVEALDAQVSTLESEIQKVRSDGTGVEGVDHAPQADGTDGSANEEEAVNDSGNATQAGWVDQTFADRAQQIQAGVDAIVNEAPTFTGKYRNLNLISIGVGVIGRLLDQTKTLKDSLRTLRNARDVKSAAAALTDLAGQVQGLARNTRMACQQPQQ